MTNLNDQNSTTAKSRETPVLRRLQDQPGVYFWRQGHWFLQRDKDAKTKKLSPLQTGVFRQLQATGQTTEPTPGFFRLDALSAKPLLNNDESPLSRLSCLRMPDGKPYIGVHELAAGEKLRRDFEKSCMTAKTTARYDASSVSGDRHWQMSDNAMARLSDAAIDARQRLHKALDAVGPELSSILYHVCCMAGGIEQAEQRLELPRRTGKIILVLALTRLARHYGLKPGLNHAGPGHIGQWAVADFKPTIVPPHQP